MFQKRKYESIFMIMDTCEAMSLFDDIEAPNLILLASSAHHESALSYEFDGDLNTNINDQFMYEFAKFIESEKFTENTVLADFKGLFPKSRVKSEIGFKMTKNNNNLTL